jgi:integrase
MGNAQLWTVHHPVGRLARCRAVGSLQVKVPPKWLCSIFPSKLPVALTKSEVKQILVRLSGNIKLILQLLYGSGLRVNEAV